jgi:DNA repair protein RecN (Recombination protein N)
MIFDEVDTGVSGAVAEAVGKRLQKLGMKSVVLVVTHLPQVAAFGASHFKVRKEVKGNETFTRIEVLNEKNRREEIARMLAGSTITDEAIAAAKKLLETAA